MAEAAMPDNSNLKPNSHKYHQEQERKPAEKVVSGSAQKQRKSLGKQIKEAMIGDAEEVRSYLLWDVFVPAVKDTIVDLIKAFAEGLFHSAGSRRSGNGYIQRQGPTSYVSYSSYSNGGYARPQQQRPMRGSYNPRSAYDFSGIVYDSRADAENVLNALAERTMMYGMASVADLYELSGIASSYTDTDWGWAEVSGASVERVRDGYILNLRKPERLD